MNQLQRIDVSGMPRQVQGFCTTRFDGFSAPPFDSFNLGDHVGDQPEAVGLNRRRLLEHIPNEPIWLRQVHGIEVVHAEQLEPDKTPVADAIVTTERQRVLAIMTADCMPVVFADSGATILGMAHAGWRGLLDGVLQETVKSMRDRASGMDQWHAWIGPCISLRAFQVGADVRDRFLERGDNLSKHFIKDPRVPEKWLCDLPGIAATLLYAGGAASVTWCGLCTATDERGRFFSYRRDGQTGRLVSVAWLSD
jgi:polyphenol oxidase